jgi:hypothetical protein
MAAIATRLGEFVFDAKRDHKDLFTVRSNPKVKIKYWNNPAASAQ